jgi:hypothetical protein
MISLNLSVSKRVAGESASDAADCDIPFMIEGAAIAPH